MEAQQGLHTAAEGGIGREVAHTPVVEVGIGLGGTVDIAASVEGGIQERRAHHIAHGVVEVMAAHIYLEVGTALAAGVYRTLVAVGEADMVLGEADIVLEVRTGPEEVHTHIQVAGSLLNIIRYHDRQKKDPKGISYALVVAGHHSNSQRTLLYYYYISKEV